MKKSSGARIALAQALLVAASLYVFLKGWRHDFRVPLGFSGDSLFYLMQCKGTIDNGWWWFNSMIGAPWGLNELVFPSNSNVDQSIVWVISRFVSHAAMSVNLAWASMVVLSGLSATWCMRTLGASTISAVVAGTLFALTPYALYRNINHFAMVIYLVPFAGTVALLLASGRVPEHGYWKGAFGLLLAGCALLGFNYVYYAFFGCLLISLASIVGVLAHGRRRILVAGGLCLALIGGCTLLNLAPSLYVLQRDGKPTILRDKVPAESEVYGMKIRQLISPAFQHTFPPFRWWNHKESAAQFPLETENRTSRLGLVGTVGFLGLLGLLLVPGAADRTSNGTTLLSASQLTIAAVLLGTIGGFGSVFSLLVSPEIRAYNRISPFIAFFSLTAVALVMDALLKTRPQRMVAAAIVLAVGLADQRMAASRLNAAYPPIAAELPPLEAFVRQLEGRLPDRAMVLQLPFRVFLNDSGIARMQPYDHLKLYFVSHRIRWSYPALSNEQVRWQRALERLDPRQLPHQLAAEGFAAVVIDRYGYADNGSAVAAAICAGLPGDSVIAETSRYLALDVRPLAGVAATAPRLSHQPVPASLAMGACRGAPLATIEQIR
jgi:phosphoglycerol transferase